MSYSGGELNEESASTYFEPIVYRPIIDVKTSEENETCLFTARAKLFRFDVDSDKPEWKERGTGELKILENPGTHQCRIIMRRDKTQKVCANHYILPCMELKKTLGSDRGFVWNAPNDFADNILKYEILGIRFANPEIAQIFRRNFDNCRRPSHVSRHSSEQPEKDAIGLSKISSSILFELEAGVKREKDALQITEALSELAVKEEVGDRSVDDVVQ